jgi:hypothetical protein
MVTLRARAHARRAREPAGASSLVTVYAGEETKKKFGQLQNYLVSTCN